MGYGVFEVNQEFRIPLINEYEHTIEYTPNTGEDSIRVIIDRPNTDILLLSSSKDS